MNHIVVGVTLVTYQLHLLARYELCTCNFQDERSWSDKFWRYSEALRKRQASSALLWTAERARRSMSLCRRTMVALVWAQCCKGPFLTFTNCPTYDLLNVLLDSQGTFDLWKWLELPQLILFYHDHISAAFVPSLFLLSPFIAILIWTNLLNTYLGSSFIKSNERGEISQLRSRNWERSLPVDWQMSQ